MESSAGGASCLRFESFSLRRSKTMKVRTFDDDHMAEAELLSAPGVTGLCKVKIGDRTLARHVDRLEPLDDEARKLLKK